jgi:stearoyl-CoA desaturase (delta-9 desaturase)
MGWSWADSLWFGGSLLVWGVLVRTVYVWHITWAVNSVAHLWGYRNYDTGEHSTNNWVVALLTNGEGWHNNHHAAPRAASHGHRWWELDLTYSTLVLLRKVGLVWDIVEPKVAEARVIPKGPHQPRRSGQALDPDHSPGDHRR